MCIFILDEILYIYKKVKNTKLNLVFFYYLATTYSSTKLPLQYHRRIEA
jgi:hypothetical protein